MAIRLRFVSLLFFIGSLVLIPEIACVPEIQKINDQLYAAQWPEKGLYLVMEKVNHNNIDFWREYANTQTRMAGSFQAMYGIKTAEGSDHFKSVLATDAYKNHDLFVAYATTTDPFSEDSENISKKTKFNNIYIFVSIISKPNAILSSHLGIALALFSLDPKHRKQGLSLPLHAFAARVMRMRNPALRFMINAPAPAMEAILYTKLPREKLFIGTREMQKIAEETASNPLTLDEFIEMNQDMLNDKFTTYKQRMKDRTIRSFNNEFHYELDNLEDGVTPEKVIEDFRDKVKDRVFPFILNDQNNFVIDEKLLQDHYMTIARREFMHYNNPLAFFDNFVPGKGFENINNEHSTEIYMRLFKENQPILSVDGEKGKYINNEFTVYDPADRDKILLHVNEKNMENYAWLFMRPWKPAGSTHYVMTDIDALVNSEY